MSKWTAPADVSSIHLISGDLVVDADGTVTAPDDLTSGELSGLSANGFVKIEGKPVVAPTPGSKTIVAPSGQV
jgi:hypothetical protein